MTGPAQNGWMHKLFAAPPESSTIKDDVARRANRAAQHDGLVFVVGPRVNKSTTERPTYLQALLQVMAAEREAAKVWNRSLQEA